MAQEEFEPPAGVKRTMANFLNSHDTKAAANPPVSVLFLRKVATHDGRQEVEKVLGDTMNPKKRKALEDWQECCESQESVVDEYLGKLRAVLGTFASDKALAWVSLDAMAAEYRKRSKKTPPQSAVDVYMKSLESIAKRMRVYRDQHGGTADETLLSLLDDTLAVIE